MSKISPFYYESAVLNETPFGEYYDQNYELNWDLSGQMDLDGDGDYEVIVAAVDQGGLQRTDAGPIVVLDFKNGRISDIGPDLIPTDVYSVILRDFVVGDFNNDGMDDLFVNNHGSEKDDPFLGEQNYLLLSDGKGGLVDATDTLPQLTDFSHGSFAADFNNDGLLDIFVNNLGEDDLTGSYVLMNLGNGNFSAPECTSQHPYGDYAQSDMFDDAFNKLYGGAYFPAVLDVNNDGNIDIWYGEVLDTRTGKFTQFYAENDGEGNFTLVESNDFADPVINKYGLSQESAEWGDLDNDGDLDLMVYAVNSDDDGGVYFQYFDNRGADGFAEVSHRIEGQENDNVLDPAGGGPTFQLFDFDADGDLDIIYKRWSPDFTEDVTYWFANDGKGNFSRIDDDLFPARQNFEIADINGDWLPDIVYEIREWYLPDEFEITGESSYSQFQLGALSKGVKRKGWNTDDRIAGGDYKDKLFGKGGDDALKGNGGNDKIIGANGDDLIYGDDGNDKLNGGKGNDVLYAGEGKDKLIGKQGADTFVFDGKKIDKNTVKDFGSGDDELHIAESLLRKHDSIEDLLDSATTRGDDVILKLGAGNVIVLQDAAGIDLSEHIHIL